MDEEGLSKKVKKSYQETVKNIFVVLNDIEQRWYADLTKDYGISSLPTAAGLKSAWLSCNSRELSELNLIDDSVSSFYRDAKTIPDLYTCWVNEIKSTENYVCRICMTESKVFVISEVCRHVLCGLCLEKLMENRAAKCPFCRQIAPENSFLWAKKDKIDEARIQQFYEAVNPIPSKVLKLMELLQESAGKTVIVTGFECMLFLLDGALKSKGFDVSLVVGDAENKTRIFKEFSTTTKPLILLTLYSVFDFDCDLSVASKIYFMEPLLKEACKRFGEACIMNRINKSEVGLLVAKNTMEEKLVGMGDHLVRSNLHKLFVRE